MRSITPEICDSKIAKSAETLKDCIVEKVTVQKEIEVITLPPSSSPSNHSQNQNSSASSSLSQNSNSSAISKVSKATNTKNCASGPETMANQNKKPNFNPTNSTESKLTPWLNKRVFFSELLTACLYHDIPICKLTKDEFPRIFGKHLGLSMPSMGDMRSHFLDELCSSKAKEIKAALRDHQIYLILRIDPHFKYGYCLSLIIGILDGQLNDSYLLKFSILHEYNVTSLNQVIINTLQSLWNGFLQFDKLRLLLTDNSSTMMAIGGFLKTLFSDLKHVTCLGQIINNLCLFFRTNNPLTEKYGQIVSTIMSIEPRIGAAFKYKLDIDLPIEKGNLLTGVEWLKAVFYYFDGARTLMELIEQYADKTHAQYVESFVEIIENKQIQEEFMDLAGYKCLVDAYDRLTKGRIPLKEQQELIDEIGHRPKRSKLIAILNSMLEKNPDYRSLCPAKNTSENGPKSEPLDPIFSYCPLVTIEADKVNKIFHDLIQSYSSSDISANDLEMLTFILYNKHT